MLVCTKRKDLQEQKHLMQLCSNDSFSSPFFPSSGQTLLSIDCYGSQHKVALRFQERDFSALQPCSQLRDQCVLVTSCLSIYYFVLPGIAGVHLSFTWGKETTSHARQGHFGNDLMLNAVVLLPILILLSSTRCFPLQHFPAFSMPVSRFSAASISQNSSCQGQAGRMCCCALHPAESRLPLC